MNERKDELIEFANSTAWAKDNAVEKCLFLTKCLNKYNLRKVCEHDGNKCGVPILYIETAGRGTGQVIKDVKVTTADFDRINPKFINVYVHYESGKVLHVKKETIRISVIKD